MAKKKKKKSSPSPAKKNPSTGVKTKKRSVSSKSNPDQVKGIVKEDTLLSDKSNISNEEVLSTEANLPTKNKTSPTGSFNDEVTEKKESSTTEETLLDNLVMKNDVQDTVAEEETVLIDKTVPVKKKKKNSSTKKKEVKKEILITANEEKAVSLSTEKSQEVTDETIILSKISDINPPQGEKEKEIKIKRTPIWKKMLASLIIFAIVISLIVGIIGLNYIYTLTQTSPELSENDFIAQESSLIYDSEGYAISELGAYLRENVEYNDLPNSVIDAFISIEDSRYFEHNGFDIPRFTKAFLENIRTMTFSQGGSTFTMQLVKNTYFTLDGINNSVLAEKSIDRKLQEIYLALHLENIMTKEEIFVSYLNKLNFGGNIRGIQKASLYYFGKDVAELNLSEAALLAGIVNRPNVYNPYKNLDYATNRRDIVLDLMYYHGYISKDELTFAKTVKVEDLLVGEEQTYSNAHGNYQSYIDVVVEEVIALTGKDPALNSMKIYTYMDKDVQSVMDGIQDGSITINFPDDLMQIAMVSMNNSTGAVVAVGGGRNYEGARLLNRATAGFKQPGSAVKPFLSYALAFEHLYWSSSHVLTDRPYTYRGGSLVLKNFDGRYRGDVMLNQAVAQSLNIPAIETLQMVVDEIGREEVAKYLQTIGFSRVTEENFDVSYAIGGTSFETTVFEMAGAHALLINEGIYNKPHTIQKVVLQDGTTIYPENQSIKALSSGSAYQAAQLMRYCVEGPYFNYMQILKRNYPVYAKTGTTDWGTDGLVYNIPRGAAKDKWMVSSTTEFTTAVWVGYDKGVKDKATYFNSYKSSLNIPGKISSILLDTLIDASPTEPIAIERPNDIETITHVLGSWPYAYAESWMDSSLTTRAEIRKGHPELTSIQESFSADDLTNKLTGLDKKILDDGTLIVTWHASGRCSNGTKDLTLNDGRNYVPATGSCILDPAILFGSPSYYATVYIDDQPVHEISSDNGYYYGWPGQVYGNVKVCGAFSTGSGTSNTICK